MAFDNETNRRAVNAYSKPAVSDYTRYDNDSLHKDIKLNTACRICGAKEVLPYKCSYCGGVFCSEHRMPEAHACTFTSIPADNLEPEAQEGGISNIFELKTLSADVYDPALHDTQEPIIQPQNPMAAYPKIEVRVSPSKNNDEFNLAHRLLHPEDVSSTGQDKETKGLISWLKKHFKHGWI